MRRLALVLLLAPAWAAAAQHECMTRLPLPPALEATAQAHYARAQSKAAADPAALAQAAADLALVRFGAYDKAGADALSDQAVQAWSAQPSAAHLAALRAAARRHYAYNYCDKAALLFQTAFQMSERLGGEYNDEAFALLNELVELYLGARRWQEFQPAAVKLLAYREQRGLGPDAASEALYRHVLRGYLRDEQYKTAEQAAQRLLAYWQPQPGKGPQLQETLHMLAAAYYGQLRYEEGEQQYRRSVELGGAPPAPPSRGPALRMRMAALYREGRVAQALEQGQAALAGWRQERAALTAELTRQRQALVPGEAAPQLDGAWPTGLAPERAAEVNQLLARRRAQRLAVADLEHDLAELYHHQGQLAPAAELYLLAQETYEQLAPASLAAGQTLAALGQLYRVQGRREAARALQQRALAVLQPLLGEAHPDVLACSVELQKLAHGASGPLEGVERRP